MKKQQKDKRAGNNGRTGRDLLPSTRFVVLLIRISVFIFTNRALRSYIPWKVYYWSETVGTLSALERSNYCLSEAHKEINHSLWMG